MKNNRHMTKLLLFDFDGTLVDSSSIKGWAFAEVFRNRGEEFVEKVKEHHAAHRGMPRREKFKEIAGFENQSFSEDELDALSGQYSSLVYNRVMKTDWIPGAQEFVEKALGRCPMHIISAAPEEEIRRLAVDRGMNHYFKGIHGAPIKKSEHMRIILSSYDLRPEEAVYFGDADEDERESKEVGVRFVRITETFEGLNPDTL